MEYIKILMLILTRSIIQAYLLYFPIIMSGAVASLNSPIFLIPPLIPPLLRGAWGDQNALSKK